MLAIAASLFLVGQAVAGVSFSNVMVRGQDSTEQNMRRYVDSIMEPIGRRQAVTSGINVTQWDTATQSACITSLEGLNGVASNPSGMAVCYNLPFLNNSTGVFEADLRLFMIAQPTGAFANIASQNVQVGLTYNGATVSAVNASSLKVRSEATSLISWPKREEIVRRVTAPTLVQSYSFVGQINKPLLTSPMGTAALQKVLVPLVTLTGVDAVGAKVNTSLSSNEATFVNGVFAAQVTPTQSRLQPPIQTLVVASDKPFIVPGLKILIFPIGLIITSIWTVLFIATVGFGTFGRLSFRDQFRRRKRASDVVDKPRI